MRFFIRVTSPGQELIPKEKRERIDNNPVLIEFLEYIFNRNPAYRPSIQDVIQRFKYVRRQLTSRVGVSPRLPTAARDRSDSGHDTSDEGGASASAGLAKRMSSRDALHGEEDDKQGVSPKTHLDGMYGLTSV